jgi:hypothetical protein
MHIQLSALAFAACIAAAPALAAGGGQTWLHCVASVKVTGNELGRGRGADVDTIFVWDAGANTLLRYVPSESSLKEIEGQMTATPTTIKIHWYAESDTKPDGAQTTFTDDITIDRRSLSYHESRVERFNLNSDMNTYYLWQGHCSVVPARTLKERIF